MGMVNISRSVWDSGWKSLPIYNETSPSQCEGLKSVRLWMFVAFSCSPGSQYLEILKDPEISEVLTHLHPKREILYQVNMDHSLWQMEVRTKSCKRVEPAWTISSNLYSILAPFKGCWWVKTCIICLPIGLLNYSSLPVIDTSLVEHVCQKWFIVDMTSQDGPSLLPFGFGFVLFLTKCGNKSKKMDAGQALLRRF